MLFGARRAITRQLRSEAQGIAEAMTGEFLARHPDWIERYGVFLGASVPKAQGEFLLE